jgi:Tfp pilus assembly protein PilN
MKLQFNLLPDVKQEYLKTQRTKRTFITAGVVAASIAFFILLFCLTTVYVINKKQLNDADHDIKKYSQELQNVKNLDKILTIQNQLKSISNLHSQKHVVSKLFTYLPQISPAHVCMRQLTLDAVNGSLLFQGSSDSQKSINTFVDTLKFTKYSVDGKDSDKYAFPSVTETQFSINNVNSGVKGAQCQGAAAPANYQLDIKYDTALFSNTGEVVLKVPQGLVTTRSVYDDPSNLFNGDALDTDPSSNTNNSSNTNTGGR